MQIHLKQEIQKIYPQILQRKNLLKKCRSEFKNSIKEEKERDKEVED
jgi:hypothetical protein